MKKTLSAILAVILLFTVSFPMNAYAADAPSQKEEVVYGILDLSGSVNNLYVVNIFNGGNITDYGNYTNIQNLTTAEKLNQSGDQITANTTADRLYYQGNLEAKELPWNIAIKYSLDGKEISGAELAGKSGALKIAISVTENPKVNSMFYNNYALQISLKLDTNLCDNITAQNATIAEAGSSKQLSYTVLPGNGTDISVTADVQDFEMEEIAINGIKLVFDMNIDYNEFTGEINQLVDAIKGLDNGAGDLLSGANQLSDGMNQYIEGMKAYNEGMSKLDGGMDKLDMGATALKDGLSELSKQNDTIINGALALQEATFASVNAQLSANGLTLPVLTPQNYSKVLAEIPALSSVKEQLDSLVQFTEGLKSYMGGVSQLSSGASNLAEGITQLKASITKINSAADDLYSAGVELNSAMKKLRDGVALYKDGTKELKSGTSNIDNEISDKVDEIIKSTFGNGDKVISFVSDKNTNVSEVQFVLKTDKIELQKVDNTDAIPSAKLSFWQKLLKLFGL